MTRFRELRKKANLTQEELIAQFNARYGRKYTAAAISQFEHDKRIPATESLKDFADFFGVSIDYLLGREDAPAAEPMGLTARDERDIERRLGAIMNDLAPGLRPRLLRRQGAHRKRARPPAHQPQEQHGTRPLHGKGAIHPKEIQEIKKAAPKGS